MRLLAKIERVGQLSQELQDRILRPGDMAPLNAPPSGQQARRFKAKEEGELRNCYIYCIT